MSDESGFSSETLALAALPCTDIGNGDRFIIKFGAVFRFVTGQGWFHFNGSRWTGHGARDAAFEAAKRVAQSIEEEVRAAQHLGHNVSARRDWAHRSQSAQRLQAALGCARTGLIANLSQFDTDRFAVGAPNGVLVFDRESNPGVSISFRPAKADDFITRQVAAVYDPSAKAPLWEQHLRVVQPNPEMRNYLQRSLGYALLGSTREQAFFIHIGAGGDGKSTTINAVAAVMGDYATAVDVNLLLARRGVKDADAPKTSLASLSGDIRMAFASEPPVHARLNEGLLKQITGGAPIRARFNYKDPFEFSPRFKVILECNSLPLVVGHDDGIWRRIRVVPWSVQIAKHAMDVDLEDKLRNEASGILNWLIEGARQYLTDRLPEPEGVRLATTAYRRSSNSVMGWFEECVEFRQDGLMAEAELWLHYKGYCLERGARLVTRKSLFEQLSRRGVHRAPSLHSRTRRVMVHGCRIVPGMRAVAHPSGAKKVA